MAVGRGKGGRLKRRIRWGFEYHVEWYTDKVCCVILAFCWFPESSGLPQREILLIKYGYFSLGEMGIQIAGERLPIYKSNSQIVTNY